MAVVGSLVLGLPIGIGLGILSVRVLGLFFALPPPVLTFPLGSLAAFAALMLISSAIGLGAALFAVTRMRASSVLREP